MKQAGKAFNRIMGDWYSDTEEGEACDACFDAGEWSGPAWGRTHEAKEKAVVEFVAKKFGITTDDVWYAAQELEYGEEERRWAAQTPWEPWTDSAGVRHHGRVCAEHRERGLNCSCIPESEQKRISAALKRGDDPSTVIDAGWGQF